jgi:chromate transporter
LANKPAPGALRTVVTQEAAPLGARDASSCAPTFAEAFREWTRIGVLSFGGPAAQIALMHRVTVDEKKWLTEGQFLNALSFCMLLPGPEAMQLATYAGWRLHGVAGGLAAGLMFVAPGAIVVLGLAATYALYGALPLIATIFFGIKAAVLVIVIEALLRVARRALKRVEQWVIAGLSFLAIFALALPFPLIVAAAAAWGLLRGANSTEEPTAAAATVGAPIASTLGTVLRWLCIWLIPLGILALWLGPADALVQLGLFFSKLAVVTFGGAYAVLAYMAETAVTKLGWLEPGQMLDGLGLAETTPGPLILVTEFVGFLAAFRASGGGSLAMGFAGAAVALWTTFAPCFLWVFAGAPYIEWLNTRPRLRGALAAITSAVVGVILNLSLWFALHVFFGTVNRVPAGPLRLWVPDVATLDWSAVLLAVASGTLLLWRHWSIPSVLLLSALLALAVSYIGG